MQAEVGIVPEGVFVLALHLDCACDSAKMFDIFLINGQTKSDQKRSALKLQHPFAQIRIEKFEVVLSYRSDSYLAENIA